MYIVFLLVLFLEDVSLSDDLFNKENLKLLDYISAHSTQLRYIAEQELYFLLASWKLSFLDYHLVLVFIDAQYETFVSHHSRIIVSNIGTECLHAKEFKFIDIFWELLLISFASMLPATALVILAHIIDENLDLSFQ